MSLLQKALDRAENPEQNPLPEAPKPSLKETPAKEKEATPVISKPSSTPGVGTVTAAETQHQPPRLNAIRFYETENLAVEEAIQKTRKAKTEVFHPKEEAKDGRRNFLGLILFLLIVSLGAVKFILPSSKPAAPAASPAVSIKPQPIVVKTDLFKGNKPAAQAKFLLTGITASGDTSLAVINNQVVGTGDKLREGAVVKSITDTRVVLDFDGKQITLNF